MKKFNFKTTLLLVLLASVTFMGCNIFNIEDRSDPNNSELENVIQDPSRAEINTLVTGTESSLRTDLRIYHINLGMVGREMYRFLQAEPRNTQDLLGGGSSQLDAGAYYTTRPWAAFYASIRNANTLLQAVDNTKKGVLTKAEKKGVQGFANTIKAYEYLMALNLMNENGIRRQNATDPQKVGDLLNKDDALAEIAKLLNDAKKSLENAGSEFSFSLSEGFTGFDSPSGFLEFNRALRARIAVYQENYDDALGYLSNSFIDASGSLTTGVYHIYSTDPNDLTNPVFANPQSASGDSYVVHPSFVAEAEQNDNRVKGNKAILRMKEGDVNTATLDNLASDYGLNVYETQTSPFPIIRNAELLLIRAEANINSSTPNLSAAESDLNVIRSAAGLSSYGGSSTKPALNDEMLKQRRYELFFEGHRWVDMRRFGRLSQLPTDRPDDNVWESFPLPESENVGS